MLDIIIAVSIVFFSFLPICLLVLLILFKSHKRKKLNRYYLPSDIAQQLDNKK